MSRRRSSTHHEHRSNLAGTLLDCSHTLRANHGSCCPQSGKSAGSPGSHLARLQKSAEYQAAVLRAWLRTERQLSTWRRGQRTRLPISADRVPVIFCTWRRLERLPHTLNLLAEQNVPLQALIWNNSPQRTVVDHAAACSAVPATVHHSGRNIGGFGRFYLAREAAIAGHDRVIFIDDDLNFGPEAIGDLLEHHRPHSLSGSWAFIFAGVDYWGKIPVNPGDNAAYVGTRGMVADTAVFSDARLFRCPRRFWYVEDLWLCFAASHLAGYEIFKTPAQFDAINDGRDQFMSLRKTKQRFLEYLLRQGWQPITIGRESSGNGGNTRAGTAAG